MTERHQPSNCTSDLCRLLDQGLAGIFSFRRDATGHLQRMDRSAEAVIGLPPERLPIDLAGLLTSHPANETFREHLLAVPGLEGDGPFRFVVQVRRPDNTLRWMEIQEAPFGQGVARFEGICIDVTELAESREAMARSSQAKNEFLANMSHEVRTPLNVIMGMTELALAACADSGQRTHLESVRGASEHMLALVNDYLDLARMESGVLTLDEDDFNLHDLASSIVSVMEFQTRLRDFELTLSIDPSVPAVARGDARRLRQVLTNLLGNACKFTRRGSVSLAVAPDTGAPSPGEGVPLLFSVRDTGPGIAPEDVERIFDTFSQAGESTHELPLPGAGLGLAISRSLVERMGGRIWVESEPGVGSVFHFTARLSQPRGPVDDLRESEAAPPPGRALSILVAEDFEPNRTMIKAMFESRGHRAACVDNGADAVDAFGREPFDVVFMDLHMPVMDGFTAVKRIREQEHAAGRPPTPIVALTADTFGADRDKCFQAGMDDYLSKPISPRRLFSLAESLAGAGTAPAGDANPPEVDFALALALMDGQDDVLMVTLLAVIGNFPIRMVELEEALAADDFETTARLAHSMKSTLLNIGAERAGKAALDLEQAAGTEDGDQARAAMEAFSPRMQAVMEAVEGYIQGR